MFFASVTTDLEFHIKFGVNGREKEIFHQFAETQWPWSIEQVMRSEMKRLLTPINNQQ